MALENRNEISAYHMRKEQGRFPFHFMPFAAPLRVVPSNSCASVCSQRKCAIEAGGAVCSSCRCPTSLPQACSPGPRALRLLVDTHPPCASTHHKPCITYNVILRMQNHQCTLKTQSKNNKKRSEAAAPGERKKHRQQQQALKRGYACAVAGLNLKTDHVAARAKRPRKGCPINRQARPELVKHNETIWDFIQGS